jgi:predicted histone-like DNA-binding protein
MEGKVNYKSILRQNPLNREEKPKHYVMLEVKETLGLESISRLVSDGSTLRESDIYAVLISVLNLLGNQLATGNAIELGDIGKFSLVCNSEGVATEEEVSHHLIKRVKIRFSPGRRLKDVLNNLRFNKIPKPKEAVKPKKK